MSYYSRVQKLLERQDAFSQKPILKELEAQIINATAALKLNDTNWEFLDNLWNFPSDNRTYITSLPIILKDALDIVIHLASKRYGAYTITAFRTTACKLYLQLYDVATEGTTARRQRPLLDALQGIKDLTIAIKKVKNMGYPTLQSVLDAYPEIPETPVPTGANTLGNFPKKLTEEV